MPLGSHIIFKIVSENKFSGKTYFYTIHPWRPQTWRRPAGSTRTGSTSGWARSGGRMGVLFSFLLELWKWWIQHHCDSVGKISFNSVYIATNIYWNSPYLAGEFERLSFVEDQDRVPPLVEPRGATIQDCQTHIEVQIITDFRDWIRFRLMLRISQIPDPEFLIQITSFLPLNREVQLDLTPEIEEFHMLFDRCHTVY